MNAVGERFGVSKWVLWDDFLLSGNCKAERRLRFLRSQMLRHCGKATVVPDEVCQYTHAHVVMPVGVPWPPDSCLKSQESTVHRFFNNKPTRPETLAILPHIK